MSAAAAETSAALPDILPKKSKRKKKKKDKKDKKDKKSALKNSPSKKNVEASVTQSTEHPKTSLAPIESSNAAAATANATKPENALASVSGDENSKKNTVIAKSKLAPMLDKSGASAASMSKAQTDNATPENATNTILKNVEAFLGANWARLQRMVTRTSGQAKYDAETQLQSICGKVVRTLVIQRIQAFTNLVSTCHKYRKKSKNVTLAEIKRCAQDFGRLAGECTVGGWNRVCISSFPCMSNHPRLSQLLPTTSVADRLSVREMHVALQACSALGLLLRHNSSVQAKKGRQTMLAHLTAMAPTLSRYKEYHVSRGWEEGD